MSSTDSSAARGRDRKPRVLIVVRGGVADFVADDGVDVTIFDWDNYDSSPELTEKPTKEFEDLAIQCGIPTAIEQDSESK